MKNLTAKTYAFLFLAIMAMVALLSSCVTKKQRERICRECAGRDSVSYVETEKSVLKDTTVYLTVPGPVQFLENPCKNLCDSLGRLKPFKIEKKENGLTSVIQSYGDSIRADCKADSLAARIQWLEKQVEKKAFEKKVVPAECEKEHRNWFDHFCRWTSLVLGAWLLIRYGWILLTKFLNRSNL